MSNLIIKFFTLLSAENLYFENLHKVDVFCKEDID